MSTTSDPHPTQNTKASAKTVTWLEISGWHLDNKYILSGYRREKADYLEILASLTFLHNETCNVYTHLIGTGLLLLVATVFLRYLDQPHFLHVSSTDYAMFGIYFWCAGICLILSTLYHLMIPYSQYAEQFLHVIDLLGIVIVTVGTFSSGIYYIFFCEASLQKLHWVIILTTGTVTGILISNPSLRTPRWRKVKVSAFVVFGASSFIPLLHGVQRYGLYYMLKYSGMKWYLLELAFYGIGVGLYAFRIPERLAPGTFDIWGSSHQIFHIAILCAMYTHVIALLQGFTTSHTLNILKSSKFPIPKIDTSSVEAGISQLRNLEALFPPPPPIPEVAESKHEFTARDGFRLIYHVFQPATPSPTTQGPLPLLIYWHGGGGSMGNAYSVCSVARDLVTAHNIVVVSPQYRLAPEYPWPTGVHDAWDAFAHISSTTDASAGLLIGGVSQGARLASIVALQAKDAAAAATGTTATSSSTSTSATRLPKVTGLYFDAPSFISPDNVPDEYKSQYRSRHDKTCLAAPILDADTKALFDKAYQGDQMSPLYVVLNTRPLSRHAGVADKAYFSVCGMDILRDDGLIYADVLENLGVQTRVSIYPGAPHAFWVAFGMTALAQKWKTDKTAGVGWLLGRE
ncbi:hypothetical protein PV08_10451 [Exophiala spinifera]|uniref:Alpha/beta hydrolase fold-3 domain-containing protein n=1 Tax=Exophiala spinifera TaxID=91928 RepID=A0A0D1Y850_9EURO|nr:uncharacterized protein PV08_10451 [Exophiala spinifera]KIW11151.1 hypothetical protein PV08_10451 [Exophiala spinifera]